MKPKKTVIVLTGLEDNALSKATGRAGAQYYLVKGQVKVVFYCECKDDL